VRKIKAVAHNCSRLNNELKEERKPGAPLFSVITVARNHLAGLTRSYQSLAAQSFCVYGRAYEWIVVDGSSSDGSAAFLQTTAANWTSEPDGGIYEAMNKGIDRARGDYLLFLNAGDAFAAPDVLARLATTLDGAAPAPALIYGDALEAGHYKTARPHTSIKRGLFTHHQAILYHRKMLGALRYDPAYRIAADYKFTAQFLGQTGGAALYCPLAICDFEPGGVSQRHAGQGRTEQAQIRAELGLAGPLANRLICWRQYGAVLLRRVAPALYWRLRT